MVPNEQQSNSDVVVALHRPRLRRSKTFRVRLQRTVSEGLERAAAARGLAPERLLAAIGRVAVADHLIDAILDDDKLL